MQALIPSCYFANLYLIRGKLAMELPELWRRAAADSWGAIASIQLVGGLLFFSLLLLRRRQPKLKLPPSPFPSLPLLGHVFHLHSVGRAAKLEDLRNKLGPIFTLHVGNTPLIYITSDVLAHEALIDKGLLFADRPTPPSRIILSNNFRSINTAAYGPHWRVLRRNLVQEMLAVPKVSDFMPIRQHVLDDMISNIRAEALRNDGVVSVYAQLRNAMFQLLIFMCFGFHMSRETLLEVYSLSDEVLALAGGSLTDFYPFLRVLSGKRRREERAVGAKQVKMFTALIEKHKEMHKLGQLASGSYLETLLNNVNASIQLSMDDLVTLCSEFMNVATDTTVTTLEWAMARIVDNPSLQEKLHEQIDAVNLGDKLVEEDLQQIPYLQATIMEALRLHPAGHFLLPHGITKACKVGGYDIPRNAIVMFHVMFIAKDPKIWEEPLKFKPERFLESSVDITCTKKISMMPFGAGRRICPGINLAIMHMGLFIARLLQIFEWSVAPPASAIDFSERVRLTVQMKKPLKALVKERMKFNISSLQNESML